MAQPLQFRTRHGAQRYADLVAAADRAVVCLDFDGVLAPIVEDPDRAAIHPAARSVLPRVVAGVQAMAVVTGRPVARVLTLGGLEELGSRLDPATDQLQVLGQYGNERWSAAEGRIHTPEPPPGLASFAEEVPELLVRAEATGAHVERKSLAVAVHTRRLADPHGTLQRLTAVLGPAASRHGLVQEPGRMVLEVRAPGMDKGDAVRALHAELAPDAMLYAGDDLGDVAAFHAIDELRGRGMVGLLVCSGSAEQHALVELADLVVPGPDGVMALLSGLAEDISGGAPG